MIRDPGAGGPHENPEPQPAIKYERIPYDLGHRPPLPAVPPPAIPMDVDSETPLDMTVRRKDSDRQQTVAANSSMSSLSPAAALVQTTDQQNSSSSSSSSNCGGDGPINLNTRPSVITKAPPPPIKKRISSMHSNGEIVIKSAVGDNLSPVNCDVFIEEHFRRSLGNTYASIYGNNNNNQPKSSETRNSSTSSSSSISSSSSTSSLVGSSVNFSVNSHLGSVSPVVRHNHVIPPVEISSLLKIKPEPGLVVQHQQQPQPASQPQSPHIRPEISVKTEPGTMQHVRPDSEEEVDDHFAKALGNDTWKMIQEKKLNL